MSEQKFGHAFMIFRLACLPNKNAGFMHSLCYVSPLNILQRFVTVFEVRRFKQNDNKMILCLVTLNSIELVISIVS